jgi:hypothetical protein
MCILPHQVFQCFHTFTGHSDSVNTVAFSPDNQTLVSGSDDSTIKIWHLSTGAVLNSLLLILAPLVVLLSARMVRLLPVAVPLPNLYLYGEHLNWDNTIQVWDLTTEQQIHTITGHSDTVTAVAISPDSQILASVSWDNTIKVWELSSGNLLHTLIVIIQVVLILIPLPSAQTVKSLRVKVVGISLLGVCHRVNGCIF